MNDELAIIGRLPGYNDNIDLGGIFEQDLLKGVTFIDLFPTAYVDALELSNLASTGEAIASSITDFSTSGNPFGVGIKEIFTKPGIVKSIPNTENVTGAANDPSAEMFQGILRRMKSSFGLSEEFAKKKALRIIAANDSTFTETFTNSFDNENMISGLYNNFKGKLQSQSLISQFTKGAKSFNSMGLANLVGKAHETASVAGNASLNELMVGAVLGMNIAAPALWSASQYNSTLTMFVKLVSPTGQPNCIRKNILEPLMYLIAASSPITAYGIVYGFPLLWQVHAHGITNFRIGSIAALSIIRGSFETTFTKALQPTVIDVRLTMIPLLTDFAVQTEADASSGIKNIYDDSMAQYLGVQNPADINRGLMNKSAVAQNSSFDEIVSVKL